MVPPRPSPGFTLVELILSVAIGSIILLLAGGLLSSSGDGYERIGGNVSAEREARALITQLTADLSSAKFHPDAALDTGSGSWPADRIGFLSLQTPSAQTDASRIGDLCAVHYYLKDLTIGGKTVRCLMRGFHDSVPTFEALRNGDVASLFTPRENLDEPLAFGVVSFTARPKSRSSGGQWIDWPENPKTGPEILEVHLVIARRHLLGRLQSPADWDGAGNSPGSPADTAKNPNLEIYQTLIRYGHDPSR